MTCNHPITLNSLCALCGQDLSSFQKTALNKSQYHSILHSTPTLKLSPASFQSFYDQKRQNLLKQKRLILLVDLDQTVVSTVVERRVYNEMNSPNEQIMRKISGEDELEIENIKDSEKVENNEQNKCVVNNEGTQQSQNLKANKESAENIKERTENFKNTKESTDSIKDDIEESKKVKKAKNLIENACETVKRLKTLENNIPGEIPAQNNLENISDNQNNSITYKIDNTLYTTYIRPDLQNFLKSVSTLYELHIYTAGAKIYVEKLYEGIDWMQGYFGERVVTRCTDDSKSDLNSKDNSNPDLDDLNNSDDVKDENKPNPDPTNTYRKSLTRLFGTNTDIVVIIDDRADVWQYIDNLMLVRPYFGGSDRELENVTERLKEIHSEYFYNIKNNDLDSKNDNSDSYKDLDKDIERLDKIINSSKAILELDNIINQNNPIKTDDKKDVSKIMRNKNKEILAGMTFYSHTDRYLINLIEMHGGTVLDMRYNEYNLTCSKSDSLKSTNNPNVNNFNNSNINNSNIHNSIDSVNTIEDSIVNNSEIKNLNDPSVVKDLLERIWSRRPALDDWITEIEEEMK